jgi:hypothetical protein
MKSTVVVEMGRPIEVREVELLPLTPAASWYAPGRRRAASPT